MGWPGEIMLGGPQLPGQLTAINKENVVHPAPEASGAAKSGLPLPRRRHRRQRWGAPEQTRVQRIVAPGAQPPPSVPGFPWSCVLVLEGVLFSSQFPSEKLPVCVVAEGWSSPMIGKLIRGAFGVHSARPSLFALHGVTPVLVLPQVCLPQLLLASGREGGPCHARPCTLPP